jgi:hypothetical protein
MLPQFIVPGGLGYGVENARIRMDTVAEVEAGDVAEITVVIIFIDLSSWYSLST